MSDLHKAAGMALVALNSFDPHDDELWYSEKSADEIDSAITALRQALTQPEQEPVAWVDITDEGKWSVRFAVPALSLPNGTKFYTAPPKREWVGLTRRELDIATLGLEDLSDCYKAIEAKLKEKNT